MIQIPDYSIYNQSPYILAQFLDTNLIDILAADDTQANALEIAGWDLATKQFLATAVGSQLDVIGIELNLARSGLSDTDYRSLLSVQSTINAAGGVPETLIKLLRDFLGCTNISIGNYYPAKIWVLQDSAYTLTDLRKYLIPSVPSGVGLGIQAYLIDNNIYNVVDNNGNNILCSIWA